MNLLRNFDRESVTEVHFYGSGCGAEVKKQIIRSVLSELFNKAEINVYTDILGAARALFNDRIGIACILGTGSNSCLYNGKEIVNLLPSLGFIFGDEGSGSHLGKLFMSSYFKDKLPDGIKDSFINKYKLTDPEILDAIYRRPFPNRFLATFSQFICEKSGDKFMKKIIDESFNGFIDNYIRKYKNYKKMQIGFVGSVAYFFKKNLEDAFRKNEMEIKEIIKAPIERLADFHKKKS